MPTGRRQGVVPSGGAASALPSRRSSYAPVALPHVQATRRQRIIETALQMLRDSKGENVEIRDVAQQAGLALGTVYRYVGSKERLLAEVYRRWWAEKSVPIARRVAKGTTNSARLRLAATGTIAAFDADIDVLRMRHYVLSASTDPRVQEILDEVNGQCVQLYMSALQGVAAADARTIAVIVLSYIVAWTVRLASGQDDAARLEREVAKMIRILLEFRDPTLAASRQPPN